MPELASCHSDLAKKKGSDRRRIGNRVSLGDGLAAQCGESLQMPLAVPGKC